MQNSEEANPWRLAGGPYVGEISALSLLPFSASPLLLAGTGSELLLYDIKSGNLKASFQVFDGIRVHGITHLHDLQFAPRKKEYLDTASYFSIAVFGERRVKLFALIINRDDDTNQFCLDLEQILPAFDHWVLDVCFFEREKQIVIGLSDNSVALWDVTARSLISRVKSDERCLLYCMRLCGESTETLQVASGTIYNEIIIWKLANEGELVPINLGRLVGHEGSIFRLAWSNNGSKLISASDDRSARIWDLTSQNPNQENLALFGHNARIWDCYISDSIIITAGEDCTCRVWDMDGNQIMILKEHIGRGIWRCLYEPSLSLIITAGFDSAIKIHEFPLSLSKKNHESTSENINSNQFTSASTISAPKTSNQISLMDSKSEYVRCIQFTQRNVLYVSTNNGHLYHVNISDPKNAKWTHITQVNEKISIICMDIITGFLNNKKDIIALGDGKGNVTLVIYEENENVDLSFSWLAEKERQLLGVYWCKSLGYSYLLTANPRGVLKLWDVGFALKCNIGGTVPSGTVPLVAVFESCFGARIMCVDASPKEQILIAGDNKGNLSIFPFTINPIKENTNNFDEKIAFTDRFKGAHGISSVTSIYISESNSDDIEIRTTGGDGCICFFKYRKSIKKIEFIGMKQVKELGTLQSVSSKTDSLETSIQATHAIGFTSSDFIIQDLLNDTKILEIPCGGWRRPYSYHLGSDPQHQNCFAYLKDQEIHIHRIWANTDEKQLIPQVVHMQFHGREIHTLTFVSHDQISKLKSKSNDFSSVLVATGCEDGTVRLTKYSSSNKRTWTDSKLLGEHVGGSAVRSICFTPKIYAYKHHEHGSRCKSQIEESNNDDDNLLLISVGSKQVLTCWVLNGGNLGDSFQWISTHMPPRINTNRSSERREKEDQIENDWRYMAVTAFISKCTVMRISVCFVVVACSDATLILRALLLPSRLWFDVATLGPQTSPILALQHIVFDGSENNNDDDKYIAISGSTDGTITFWDLTKSINNFMDLISEIQPQTLIDHQTRPKTGRGSHGGRKWRSLSYYSSKNTTANKEEEFSSSNSNSKSNECLEIGPLCVFKKVHQSGVNCLHVARFEDGFVLVSGGDDQAVHNLIFGLESPVRIRVYCKEGVASAHSSAVKGIWTDGKWVFSTGLDQRIRVWNINESGKLIEYTHLIISVPEPETLDAIFFDRENEGYLIAVAGRGMQMVEFYATGDTILP